MRIPERLHADRYGRHAPWTHLVILLTACTTTSGEGQSTASADVPTTGREVPALRAFDRAVQSLIVGHGIPGASLAVVRDGRLVLARGYGYADTTTREPVRPEHRFRIASVTKPVTAAAILKLVEQDRLRLEDRPFEILSPNLSDGRVVDPGTRRITVRHLLQHRGGYDRRRGLDPTLVPGVVAESLGVEQPLDIDHVIRFMLGRPLEFDPGTGIAYSNFGYAVLGAVIEEASGDTYEKFTRENVLEPAGIHGMQLGRSFAADRPDDEVSYYHPDDPSLVPAIPPKEGVVPLPDGGFDLELMAAHGGWIASPTDLLRFLTAVDGSPDRPDILRPATVEEMTAAARGERPDSVHYGLGWYVRLATEDSPETWWHEGDLPGSAALLVRAGRTSWAFSMNRSPWDRGAHEVIRRRLEEAARAITEWPDHDLF